VFEKHLDFHFQVTDDKLLGGGRLGRFVDKQRFQGFTFNFLSLQSWLIRRQGTSRRAFAKALR